MVCILYDLQKAPTLSVYSIYQLVFVVIAESFLFVEQNESLYLSQLISAAKNSSPFSFFTRSLAK
jgi:hypothetical protein